MYYRIFALVTIKALVIADVFYYILVFLYLQSTYSCLSAMDDGVPIGRNNYWQLRKIYRVLKDDRIRHKTVYSMAIKFLFQYIQNNAFYS